jgi:Uma2 family endonuclease
MNHPGEKLKTEPMLLTKSEDQVFTIEEYLNLEDSSSVKHEFHDGKIIEMSGGTAVHNEIALKIAASLLWALEDKATTYKVYNSDMKIQIPEFNHFVYPDAVVVCEQPNFYEGRKDIITNPLLVVEVASLSTEEYDRGLKFYKYKTLPTFKEYVLVSQDKVWISSFFRKKPDTWVEAVEDKIDQSIYLKSIDIHLPLQKVFGGVDFE